jgi:hypothetical protein
VGPWNPFAILILILILTDVAVPVLVDPNHDKYYSFPGVHYYQIHFGFQERYANQAKPASPLLDTIALIS